MSYIRINKGDNRQTRQAKKTFNNSVRRKDKFYDNSVRRLSVQKKGKYYTVKKRPIRFEKEIEKFCNSNYKLNNKSSRLFVKLNQKFSFFEDPATVLLALLNLLRHAKELQTYPKVSYDGYVSFGAIYMIDNLCWEIGKKRKWLVDFQKFPNDERSILSNLRSIVSSSIEDENEHMINERILINRNDDLNANQPYRAKAKEITDMIEKAFRKITGDEKFELSFEAHGAIKSAIGEQFDNILLHAAETSHGTLCGFFNKKSCEITLLIYNFGKTIAETLTSEDLPDDMWDKIGELITQYKRKKLLNFTKRSEFTLENALTLFALQEGVSSRIKFDITRGCGLIDFIGHCFSLSNETQVAIISGKTAIKIDKKYPIGEQFVFGRRRRVIALNTENDIFSKPDSNYIRNIGVSFNGVIIETTIPLKKIENGNNNGQLN
jgi:hypothetical protein